MQNTEIFEPYNKKNQKIFLRDLSDDLLVQQVQGRPKRIPIMVVGTVIRINRNTDFISVFFLEDMTKAHVVEVFRDKLPYGVDVELGQKFKIKGEYTFNKYKEKIIKGFRMQKITLEEECLFYLEILRNQKRKKDKFNELEIIQKTSKSADDLYERKDANMNILYKKLFSMIFDHLVHYNQKYLEMQGYMTKEKIMEIKEVQMIYQKVNNEEDFEVIFQKTLQKFEELEIMTIFEEHSGYVFLLDFFINFEDQFYNQLHQYLNKNKKEEFQTRKVQQIMNDILNVKEFLLNREFVYQFIHRQIQSKKMYFKDQKKQNLCLFQLDQIKLCK